MILEVAKLQSRYYIVSDHETFEVREMAWKIGLWVARILATVLIACMLSIWTTSYVVTSYVQALLKQYEIPLEVKHIALADVWSMIWGTEQSMQMQLTDTPDQELSDATHLSDELEESETVADSANVVEGSKQQDSIVGNEEYGIDEPHIDSSDDTNLEVDEFTDPSQEVFAPIETGSKPTITPEEIDASKESLAVEDKERMFELIMGKLPPQSWQFFSSAMEDGLTEQELLEVQQMMAQHLSREEYNELMEMLK
jgi:hypothetical protein